MAATIGQELKTGRLAKGLSLEDVSHATKIPVAALEAMERDDFAVFPGLTYRRGFLNLYSRYLGIDAAEALAAMSPARRGRRNRPDFLQTDLKLRTTDQTIPIVKHRVIELKPKRSLVGIVLFVLLSLMIPAVYYAGKWAGLREGVTKEKTAEVTGSEGNRAEALEPRQALRAQVIKQRPEDQYSDLPVRVYTPDAKMNALIGLDAVPASR